MSPSARGIDNAWGGLRTTREFVSLFPEGQGGIVSERNIGNTANYSKVYVPGTHQGNDPTDTRNSIAAPVGTQFFFGHKYFPEPNTEIRFTRIPAPGAPVFGDNQGEGTLEMNGAPIVVPEAGLHYIEVDFSTMTYSIERRDWELQGSAVPGSEPVTMGWNHDERALEVEIELHAGEISFIGNSDQDLVLGDNGGDGILEIGGDPITKIEFAGTYKIYLYIEQPDYSYKITTNVFDRRGLFFTRGQTLDIEDVTPFTQGYAITKFSNITSTGAAGSNLSHVDTDFPLFRLADTYLMAAEAALRGGGSTAQAVEYFNRVRQRAYQGSLGNVSAEELTLDLILEERGRELYWECHRRTDLIRFDQFTDGTYVWNWKGGVMEGQQVPSFRNIYPIPEQDLNANPNLRQNEGY
ncbi:MAG: RagB/SusD family nutrient uptake outer membrane protein [Saprospirales bacterium]|nr:MAG: RagB/SusD family nutrient uptake outer membrane protein [Saprospirales bacterium]